MGSRIKTDEDKDDVDVVKHFDIDSQSEKRQNASLQLYDQPSGRPAPESNFMPLEPFSKKA